jgi:hypothetical protein
VASTWPLATVFWRPPIRVTFAPCRSGYVTPGGFFCATKFSHQASDGLSLVESFAADLYVVQFAAIAQNPEGQRARCEIEFSHGLIDERGRFL